MQGNKTSWGEDIINRWSTKRIGPHGWAGHSGGEKVVQDVCIGYIWASCGGCKYKGRQI